MTLLSLLTLLLCLRVAISDLYARRVPNRWLALAAVGALAGWLIGMANGRPVALPAHLLGAVLGLAALLPFYLLGWMGAGDVKFFSVLGLLLGWQALLPVWIIASLLAGAHVACVLGVPRLAAALPLRLQLLQARAAQHWLAQPAAQEMKQARQGRRGIPFAAYLAFAAMAAVCWPLAGGSA